MKNTTIIKCFVIFFLVSCIGVLILNQNKDTWFSYHQQAQVSVVYMVQDPDSGEYANNGVQSKLRVEKDQPYTYSPHTLENYSVNYEKSFLSIESVSEETEFVVYYDCELVTLTFDGNGGDLACGSEGLDTQQIRKGQSISTVTLPEYQKQGYDLVGFLPNSAKVYENTTFTARWEKHVYTVYLHVIDGSTIEKDGFSKSELTSNTYQKAFDFETDFDLPIPTQLHYTFKEWNTESDGSGDTYSGIAKNTFSDLHLYAVYDVETHKITYMLDGEEYYSSIALYDSNIYSLTLSPSERRAGYGLNWYEDQAYETLYEFDVMPDHDVTLYGKWEIDTGSGFIGWSPEREEGKTVDDYDELKKFVEYVRFYNVTEENYKIPVTYTSEADELKTDLEKAINASEFRCGYTVKYGSATQNGVLYAVCYCNSDNTYELNLRSTDKSDYSSYYYFSYTENGRGDDYDDFYIDKLQSGTVEVTTTNQLLYVVEHGYKPACKENSPAELVYNKAKALLNSIISTDYNDYQKAEAIYNWLVLNVAYDHNAFAYSANSAWEWYKYDAFYMEGVFNKKKAVCDGIAKSFVLLCNIEGIPCVEVSGNAHAWCKVKINNRWYVADPTHGSVQIADAEKSVTNHGEFLISDSAKASKGYTTTSYPNIKANEGYDYFGKKTFVFNGTSYDYAIKDYNQLAALLKYAVSVGVSLVDTSIDISYDGTDFQETLLEARKLLVKEAVLFDYDISVIGSAPGCVQIVFCS